MPAYQKKGFIVGLALFFILLFIPAPEGLNAAAWKVAAIAVLMAVWWATEAIPVAVTALLPLALFPLMDITSFESAAVPYANKNIYLFLGGFILALGIENSGLHKRIALKMILAVGSSGARLVGGFMLVSALISMWVMNTSTTLMLLPIGLAVCTVMADTIPGLTDKQKKDFDTALLLGIAYAATIGGMSTLIVTAPNIVFSAFMFDAYGIEISMLSWMTMAVPLSAILLFGAWILLTKYVFKINFDASVESRLELQNILNKMGKLTKDEKRISIIFGLAVFAWVFRTLLNNIDFLSGLTDAGVAIIAAILIFMTPSEICSASLKKFKPCSTRLLINSSPSLVAIASISSALNIVTGRAPVMVAPLICEPTVTTSSTDSS